jgi:hypothetical protein
LSFWWAQFGIQGKLVPPTKIQTSFHDKLMIVKTHLGNTSLEVIESSLLIGANHTTILWPKYWKKFITFSNMVQIEHLKNLSYTPWKIYIQCYITCPFSRVDLIFGSIKKVKFDKQLERQFEWLETFSNKFQIDHFKCSFCSYWKKTFQHHISVVSIEIYLSFKIMQIIFY